MVNDKFDIELQSLKKLFKKASRLFLILFIPSVFGISVLTSCDKNDDDNSNNSIVGTWVNGTSSYWFRADGTGTFDSDNVWGSIKYSLYGNTVYMNIKYQNKEYLNSIWNNELEGTLNAEKNELRIHYTVGYEIYTKK